MKSVKIPFIQAIYPTGAPAPGEHQEQTDLGQDLGTH